jgi:hypothetical protein
LHFLDEKIIKNTVCKHSFADFMSKLSIARGLSRALFARVVIKLQSNAKALACADAQAHSEDDCSSSRPAKVVDRQRWRPTVRTQWSSSSSAAKKEAISCFRAARTILSLTAVHGQAWCQP